MFSVKIKAFEKDQVILQDDDGRLYIWPKKIIGANFKIGDTLGISIENRSQEKIEALKNERPDSQKQAHEILNEILKIQEK
ncbi:MAG: hypothetical protein NT165_01865 [Candidatus Falkowbacteria bacterium]|nr:hypothetical protein [Candidatus Falkowbacteria bacterium]